MPITQFILHQYSPKIISDLKRLTREQKELFIDETLPILKVHEVDYQKASLKGIHPRLKNPNLISFYISLEVYTYSFYRFQEGFDDWRHSSIPLTLHYYFNWRDEEFLFLEAEKGIGDYYDERTSLRQDLIPYIKADYYDDEARRFLFDTYPEALKKPMPVDAFEVAKRLQLNPQEYVFEECEQYLGRTYFEDVSTNQGIISEGTVLYDTSHGNSGRLNNTIIHECFHWYKHKHYIELKKQLERLSIPYEPLGRECEYLESQARNIAPRILMPREMFEKKARSILSHYSTSSHLEALKQAILQLSDFFQVSKLSAKLRLIEVGYPEARGVLEYIDGRYLPTFSYDTTNIRGNQTFTISLDDFDRLIETDEDFKQVMSTGRYTYIESHIVFNVSGYVMRDSEGNLTLTDFARNHLDECALLFEYRRSPNDEEEVSYSEFILNHTQFSNISFQLVYQNGYEHSNQEKQDAALIKEMEEEDRIYNQLSNDFEASMKIVKQWRNNISYKEISKGIDYDERQVRRLFQGVGSLELFILVCIYLNIPPTISSHLLEKSKWKLNPNDTIHRRYQVVLNNYYCQSIEQAKDFLKKFNISL